MLGQQRYTFVAQAILAGLIFFGSVYGSERPTVRPVTKIVDPDETSESVTEADVAAITQLLFAGSSESCQSVGGVTPQPGGNFRYRGNALRIDATDATLTEFKMILRFSGITNLFFSVHQRRIDIEPESWEQVLLQQIEASGNGAYQTYSGGLIPGGLTLNPNTDYVFGVSWANTTVFFARDNVIQPKPLAARIGSTLGTVSFNNVQPPIDASLPPLTVSAVGVFAMAFCFEPVEGACCLSSTQAKVSKKEAQCTGEGSYFHGERVPLSEVNCNFGACCSPCASGCSTGFTPEACEVELGTHHRGVDCPLTPEGRSELCPPTVGACCTGVTCDEMCVHECTGIGGTYRGHNTDCTPNICVGACCVPRTGCVEATQNTCTGVFFGTFRGNGTECARLTPQNECGGACCFSGPVSSCVQKPTRAECTEVPAGIPNAVYRGDGTVCGIGGACPNIETGTGACCLPNGTCINTTDAFCTSTTAKGFFHETGTQCTELEPPACPTRGCCFDDGTCEFLTENGCTAFGGTSADSCAAAVCEEALVATHRACCLGNVGECELTTRFTCESNGGVFQSDSIDCSTANCPGFGACCTPESTCLDRTTRSRCDLLDGTFNEPEGSGCFDVGVDCDDRGACCLAGGGCAFISLGDCDAVDGFFNGESTFCETAGICPSGACCMGEGVCTIRGRNACESPLVYQGNGSTCTAGRCALGACCHNGDCFGSSVRSQCAGAQDVFGPGKTCAADTCEIAACCLETFNGSCQDLTRLECELAQGVYRPGTDCDTNSEQCLLGSCCSITGTCEEALFPFACSAPSEFRLDESCLTSPCDPRGACCVPGNEECQIMTQDACLLANGTYGGDAVACEEGLCAIGACCDENQGCSETALATCRASTGSYQGPGTTCKTVKCPLPCHDLVVTTSPSNCAIDAGYPHTPQETPTRLRWRTLDITFECEARSLIPTDFSVREEPPDAPENDPRAIQAVESIPGDPNSLRLRFDQFIKLGRWTCVTHTVSGEEICIGFLPGDIDGNGGAGTGDLDALVAYLDSTGPALPLDGCDVDRSGACFAADIIKEIDLLNDTDPKFDPGTTLPACPTTAP